MTDEPREDTPEVEGSAVAAEPDVLGGDEEAEEAPAKLKQEVEMRDIGPCKKHIRVSVDREAIDRLLNEKYTELVADANVAGFRPGKAPRKIIERRFHNDVSEQVKGEVLLQSLEQLADDHDVAPLSMPNLNAARIEIPKDGPLVYEFDVEVRPTFNLPNYKGLKLRRPVRTFSDADVETEERRLLAPYGQLVPKPEGNADLGDYLIADITTRDGDRVVSELKELKLRIEPRLAFKDAVAERFGEQMKGAGAGDTRAVDITLSENAAAEELRGKKVKATVHVQDVKALRMPELTPEMLSPFGVRSPEQLRERVRVILQWRLEYGQRQSAREQVLAQIAEASQWELPQDLLGRQARRALARKVMEMRSAGIPEEEIRGRQRLLEQDALRSTALALKEHFVLQKIAEVEKIDVTEDDLNDEIERIAAREDTSPRRVRARLEKDDLLDALSAELVERRALDLILQSAEYEDVPLGRTEESAVATIEEQAVPGAMHDVAALAEAKAVEEKAAADKAEQEADAGK